MVLELCGQIIWSDAGKNMLRRMNEFVTMWDVVVIKFCESFGSD